MRREKSRRRRKRRGGFVALLPVAALMFSSLAMGQGGADAPEKAGGEGSEGAKGSVSQVRAGPGGSVRPGGPFRQGPGGPARGLTERMDPKDMLSKEEKRRVREVLEQVWRDPKVMAAKENVQMSTDEYRTALKEAVTRVDPEVAKLMQKMHEHSRSAEVRKRFMEGMGKGMGGQFRSGAGLGGRGLGMRDGERRGMMDVPEFLRALSDEEKKIYMEARREAEQSEAIKALRSEMKELEERERDTREARFRLMGRIWHAYREEMIKVDSRVAEIVPEGFVKDRSKKRPKRPGAEVEAP